MKDIPYLRIRAFDAAIRRLPLWASSIRVPLPAVDDYTVWSPGERGVVILLRTRRRCYSTYSPGQALTCYTRPATQDRLSPLHPLAVVDDLTHAYRQTGWRALQRRPHEAGHPPPPIAPKALERPCTAIRGSPALLQRAEPRLHISVV